MMQGAVRLGGYPYGCLLVDTLRCVIHRFRLRFFVISSGIRACVRCAAQFFAQVDCNGFCGLLLSSMNVLEVRRGWSFFSVDFLRVFAGLVWSYKSLSHAISLCFLFRDDLLNINLVLPWR